MSLKHTHAHVNFSTTKHNVKEFIFKKIRIKSNYCLVKEL